MVALGVNVALLSFLVGFLLSAGNAVQDSPVAMVRQALPGWIAVAILVTAFVGLLAGAVTALYSSGMSLLALGLRVPRHVSVLVDGVLAFAAAAYVLLVAQDFVTSLQIFFCSPRSAWWRGRAWCWSGSPDRATTRQAL